MPGLEVSQSKEQTADAEVRRNSNGEVLKYDDETGCWIPEWMFMTEEQSAAYYSRFSHPKFNAFKIIANILLPVIAISGVGIFAFLELRQKSAWFETPWHIVIMCAGILFIYILLRTKALAVFCVQLYQRFAPMEIRERCVFTPTCSDYMILSIKKYGLFRGLKKGIQRLKRCHGAHREDYP